MENCAIYSHQTDLEKVSKILNKSFKKSDFNITGTLKKWKKIEINTNKNIYDVNQTISFNSRQRNLPGYKIQDNDEPITKNLLGMLNFINIINADNSQLKEKLKFKISSINTEIGIQCEPGLTDDFIPVILKIAEELDGIIFSNGNSFFETTGFYDKHAGLILNTDGKSKIKDFKVIIDTTYYDKGINKKPNQRKIKTEEIIKKHRIKINPNLPNLPENHEIKIRDKIEIGERLACLSLINFFIYDKIDQATAVNFLKKYSFWSKTTSKEKDLLENPTDNKKIIESWRSESIWVLLWALNKIENLGFPDKNCSLGKVKKENCAVRGPDFDPYIFINNLKDVRLKDEILDTADLYYRLDWACVDSKLKSEEISNLNPSVVYERHYALNWLINHKNQDWDNITCDT